MKVRHRKLRRGSIAFHCGTFLIDSQGMLSPEPTLAQWQQFGSAQMYFEVIAESPLARHTAIEAPHHAALEAVFAAPPAPPAPAPEPEASEEVFSMDEDEDDEDEDEGTMFSDDVDPNEDTADATRYSGMSTEELRTLCRERGIRTARVNKADLISLLNASDLGV